MLKFDKLMQIAQLNIHVILFTKLAAQFCGSASILMWIQDPKNVHMDPDPDLDSRG